MERGKHSLKSDQTFEDLDFNGQAKSINGQVNRLVASVKAHVKRAEKENRNKDEVLKKCIGQLARSINNLIK